jgi:heme exporter protein C
MHPDMLYPLLIMIAGLYCLFALLLLLHTRSEILVRERGTKWVKELIAAK